MKTKFIIKVVLICVMIFELHNKSFSQSLVKDCFLVNQPIYFDNEAFNLQWTTNSDTYYKQEYIRSEEKLERFSKMISIEVLVDDISLKDICESKIQEIVKRKETDPVANYQILKNEDKGEYLLDFLMYQGGVIEWNVYKYVPYRDKKNTKGVLLFAYTQRFFEGGEFSLDSFSKFIKEERNVMIKKVLDFDVSDIRLKE